MSTLKTINVIHPSGSTNNIVNDSSGNVTVGNNLYATGNVGIGTSSPSEKLSVYSAIGVRGSNFASTTYVGSSVNTTGVYTGLDSAGGFATNVRDAGYLTYSTNNTERARIDSSGNLQVGTTSNINNARVSVQNSLNCVVSYTTNNAYTTFQGFGAAGTGSATFYVGGSGQIYSTSTTITAISDGTLKTNIKPLETGLAEIMALKPRRFDWSEESINEGSNIAGFIAQEVQQVLPDLVIPFQYKTDEEKLGLKMGDMIPTLVAAIQELKAQNDDLKARVEALEAK